MFEGSGSGAAGAAADLWDDLGRLDVTSLVRLAEVNQAELVARENRVLLLACAWADAHPGHVGSGRRGATELLVERPVQLGGAGTPEVAEYACAEFGAVQGKGILAARQLIADALDLRHRLPQLWAMVGRNAVRGWQARRVAEATRGLSVEAAAEVDHVVATFIGQVGWARFERLVEAAICDADPERAEKARKACGVWASKADDGQKAIFARTDMGTAAWFMATVNRIADILAVEGDTDSADRRRAKSLGVLAQPAKALRLLIDHASEPTSRCLSVEQLGDAEISGRDRAVEPSADCRSDLVEQDQLIADRADDAAERDHAAGAGMNDQDGDGCDADDQDRCDPGEDDDHVSLDLRPPVGEWDASAARPRVVVHFHISDETIRAGVGMVRPERGEPISLQQLREFLAGSGCHVRVQPVIDPAATAPVDGYEIPLRLRRAVRYRDIADVFPWASCLSPGMDLDHSIPYATAGPPGQTGIGNLAPLSRAAHRAKTLARWHLRQPHPGTYVWRTPHGWTFLVTNQGTLPLGNTAFSHAVWQLATDPAAAG